MKRFLFLAPFALAFSASAANVKISDLALVSTPSTNTFQEIADLNASGTNKSARVFLAWTSVGGSLRPLLPATNYFFGADIFASGTNNGQNITLIGNRAAYQAIFDSATHDVFGAGFYPFRASVLQGASDVSAIGQNTLATSYLTNSADIHGWGNYALFGLSATNSSNIYGKGHSAGQGVVATGSGNLFFDGNETGLGSYFTNVTDMSLFNGALKGATISDSHNFGAFGIDALSGFTGSLTNVFFFGTNIDVYAHGLNIGPYWESVSGVTVPVGLTNINYSGPFFGIYTNDGVVIINLSAWNPNTSTNTDAVSIFATSSSTDYSAKPAAFYVSFSPPNYGNPTDTTGSPTMTFAAIFENLVQRTNSLSPLDYVTPRQTADYGLYAQNQGTGGEYAVGMRGNGAASGGKRGWGVVGDSGENSTVESVGVAGNANQTGSVTNLVAGYFQNRAAGDTSAPVLGNSVVIADSRSTGSDLFTGRTNNGTVVFLVPADGSLAAGTTNRWKTGDYVTGGKIGVNVNNTNYNLLTDTPDIVTATKAFQQYQGSLTHAGTVTLNFDAVATLNSLTLTGNLTLATSNLLTNRTARVLLIGCSTNSTLTFPAWHFVGFKPTSIAASKWAMLSLEAWGSSDSNVVASYAEEP